MKRGIVTSAICSAITLWASITLSAAPSSSPDAQATSFFIRNHDRYVFQGDSITCGEWYPTLVETYVLTRFPQWRNQFFVRGVGGDNSGNLKRFERDVLDQNPDAFSFAMGYNDAGHRRFELEKLNQFIANVTKSVELARARNPKVRILLSSPTPNETAISDDLLWCSRDPYPYALLAFGHEEARLAKRLGVRFVDMSTLYAQTMGLGYIMARKAFGLSRDGVHPQLEGQTFIAYHLLRGMGADPLLAEVEIDAKAGKVTSNRRCQVSNLKNQGGTLTFTRLCQSLPYPTPEVVRPFSFLVQLDDTINNDRLVVTGLTAPSYAISVDDRRIAEVSAKTLEDGLNLSRYPQTLMYEQSMAVMKAVRKKQALECGFWGKYIMGGKADGNGNPLPSTDAAVKTEMTEARKQVEAAIQDCYALNTPKAHTIKLEPLDKKIDPYDFTNQREIAQAFLDVVPSPVNVDWNTMTVTDKEMKVTIANPNLTDKSGTLRWNVAGSWKITPTEVPFTVAAGQTAALPFTISCPPGSSLFPVPTATIRWRWSKDWPYPVTDTREFVLHPNLTIKKSTAPVAIDGKSEEWTDATTFALEDRYFIDKPVQGKRALWDGPSDLSVRVSLKWDEKNLYVAALVNDSEHVRDPGADWSQDMLHLAFLLKEPGKLDGRCEYGFHAYADRNVIVGFPLNESAQIQFKSRVDEAKGTCLYEIAIPWERLAPFVPQPGKTFAFDLCVNDEDRQPGKASTSSSGPPASTTASTPSSTPPSRWGSELHRSRRVTHRPIFALRNPP